MLRKGQVSTTKYLILFVFIAVVLLAFLGVVGTRTKEEAPKAACHDALVYTVALSKKIPVAGEKAKPWPTTCKTQKKTIEQADQRVVTGRILELMGDCWFAMGEGQIRPFAEKWFWEGMKGATKKCFICSIVQVPNLEKTITNVEMLDEMSHKPRPDGKTTYYDYLKGSGILNVAPEPIEKGNNYAILYSEHEGTLGDKRPFGVAIRDLRKVTKDCTVVEGAA